MTLHAAAMCGPFLTKCTTSGHLCHPIKICAAHRPMPSHGTRSTCHIHPQICTKIFHYMPSMHVSSKRCCCCACSTRFPGRAMPQQHSNLHNTHAAPYRFALHSLHPAIALALIPHVFRVATTAFFSYFFAKTSNACMHCKGSAFKGSEKRGYTMVVSLLQPCAPALQRTAENPICCPQKVLPFQPKSAAGRAAKGGRDVGRWGRGLAAAA